MIASTLGLYVVAFQTNENTPEPTYPLVFLDDLGRNITLPSEPQRIITLIPSASQLVFAVGAGDKVVGVTRYDEFPPELVSGVRNGSIISVGGGIDPSIEAVIGLDPDLIFIGGSGHLSSKSIKKIQELGFIVVSLRANSVEGILGNIELLGKITGNTDESDLLLKNMRTKIDLIQSKLKDTPKVRVYIENWHDPIFTVGEGTLQDDMIKKAGGVNIFSDLDGSKQVNVEAVIARNPDVIISFNNQVGLEALMSRPGWDSINAVKNGLVFQMDTQEGSPNHRIADSLEKMAGIVHPNLFLSSRIIPPLLWIN